LVFSDRKRKSKLIAILITKMVDLSVKIFYLMREFNLNVFFTLKYPQKLDLNSRGVFVLVDFQVFMLFFWFFKSIYMFFKVFRVKIKLKMDCFGKNKYRFFFSAQYSGQNLKNIR
jgi:hypothetical protein